MTKLAACTFFLLEVDIWLWRRRDGGNPNRKQNPPPNVRVFIGDGKATVFGKKKFSVSLLFSDRRSCGTN